MLGARVLLVGLAVGEDLGEVVGGVLDLIGLIEVGESVVREGFEAVRRTEKLGGH